MGVSRNRKDHKKKSKQRTEQIKIAERKYKQRMLDQYLEIQRQIAQKQLSETQKAGEVVENNDIEVDIDLNDDELLIQDEFSILEEELPEENSDEIK
jgi:adenylyl- and sulfurtransferase ThiI